MGATASLSVCPCVSKQREQTPTYRFRCPSTVRPTQLGSVLSVRDHLVALLAKSHRSGDYITIYQKNSVPISCLPTVPKSQIVESTNALEGPDARECSTAWSLTGQGPKSLGMSAKKRILHTSTQLWTPLLRLPGAFLSSDVGPTSMRSRLAVRGVCQVA